MPNDPPGGRTAAATSDRPAGPEVCGWPQTAIAVPSRAIATVGAVASTPAGDRRTDGVEKNPPAVR